MGGKEEREEEGTDGCELQQGTIGVIEKDSKSVKEKHKENQTYNSIHSVSLLSTSCTAQCGCSDQPRQCFARGSSMWNLSTESWLVSVTSESSKDCTTENNSISNKSKGRR